jgi:hypothetical protein
VHSDNGDRDVGIVYNFFSGGLQVKLIFQGILGSFYTRNQVRSRGFVQARPGVIGP